MTPQAALTELLDRLAAQQGATVHIGNDELNSWPAETGAAMKSVRLLVKARPASSIVCPGCERECSKPVDVFPAEDGRPARAFIICNEPEDLGRIPVELHTLEQWHTTCELIADVLARLLGVSRTGTTANDGQWTIGMLKGRKHKSLVTLRAGDGLHLSLAGHTIPLIDVLTFNENALAVNKNELIRRVDKPAGNSETAEQRRRRLKIAFIFWCLSR